VVLRIARLQTSCFKIVLSSTFYSKMNDESLDASSSSYDPLASLYCASNVADPSAPIFDNVESFASHLTSSSSKKDEKGQSKKSKAPVEKIERQFTEEQMPIRAPKRASKNVVTFMAKQTEGPMSSLQNCVENEKRVKVVTRKRDGIRGFCTGILVAFDKHWNLALLDVDEEYTRKRYRRAEFDNGSIPQNATQKVGESVIRVIKTRRKTEVCQRHVPQLVIRGEQVVFVQPL